jgi:hypothetical protein
MTVTLTTDGRFRVDLRPDHEAAVEFRDKAMAEQFADLVDAGVPPTTALERVAKMRASAASEAAEKNFPNSA